MWLASSADHDMKGTPMPHQMQKAIARNSLLIKSLPAQHVDAVLSKAIWKQHERGETLFIQEEVANVIHVVIDGWVKLYRVTPNGTEAVVSIFTKGESFGEAVALKNLPYPVSGMAATRCHVMHIPTSVLIDLIRHDTEVALSVLSSTFTHLHSLVAQLEQLKAQTGGQRVAEFLLDLSDCSEGSCMVTLPYDKVLIAGKLGMKPESLSRAFMRLKQFGVKIEKNHALIEDIGVLQTFVDNAE
ncbi:Crp/Fnr family transcriptional regulator [Shimia thalassica]|uniref:Crp/Fnr family transcriptional regulator n=2 Tax=Shimia thalassica TaxID=1715693 RepID=UPI0026897913